MEEHEAFGVVPGHASSSPASTHLVTRDAIKMLVRQYLRRAEFKPRVRDALHGAVVKRREAGHAEAASTHHDSARDREGDDGVAVMRRRTVAEAVDLLRKQGLVDELTRLAQAESMKPSRARPSNTSGSVMRVRVVRADGLRTTAREKSGITSDEGGSATKVVVTWCGQRRWSMCTNDDAQPGHIAQASDTHFFDIPRTCFTAKSGDIDVAQLCQLPTRMAVVALSCSNGDTAPQILGAGVVDWYASAVAGAGAAKDVRVELFNPYESTNVPVGCVTLQVRLHPRRAMTDARQVSRARAHASQTAKKTKADVLMFVDVARLWWRDYCGVRECNAYRRVCLMARNEFGQRLPVCSFLRVLRPGRSLPSPRDAARFVSLLDIVEPGPSAAAPASSSSVVAEDVWCTAPTTIARKAGTIDELAVLLCSLFLGFGLDAFVCVGTNGLGHGCAMVLTRPSSKRVVLWDPASGKPYGGREAGEGAMSMSVAPMARVHSCFNADYIYANQQADDAVMSVSWMLNDEARWASLHTSPLTRSVVGCDAVALSTPSPRENAEIIERELEQRLRHEFFREREGIGRISGHGAGPSITWDDRLATLLMPALEAYEQEARSGIAFGNSEFQQSIKRSTPVGHTFKGFPFHANHTDAHALAASMVNEPACALMLGTLREGLRFALRCRVTCYPDDVVSVWLMLAVCYRGVEG